MGVTTFPAGGSAGARLVSKPNTAGQAALTAVNATTGTTPMAFAWMSGSVGCFVRFWSVTLPTTQTLNLLANSVTEPSSVPFQDNRASR